MQSCIIILQQHQHVEWIFFWATSTCRMNWIRTFNWSPIQGPAGSNFWAGRFVGVLLQLGYNACIGLPLIGFFFSPQIFFSFTLFGSRQQKFPIDYTVAEKPKYLQQTIIKNKIKDEDIKKNLTFFLDEGWRKSISPLNFDTRPFLFLQWAYNHFQRPNQVLNSYYKLKLNILYAIKSLFSSGCLT